MARVVSRKACIKKTARTLHKRARTLKQHKKVVGKASKACSKRMRMKRAGKKMTMKRKSPVNYERRYYNVLKKMDCSQVVTKANELREGLYKKIIGKKGVKESQIDGLQVAVDRRLNECGQELPML
jgi:uncharacterized protein YjbK